MFSTSSRDKGRFPCFHLRGILTSPSNLKKRPVSLIATRENYQVPSHNSTETPSFRPQLEKTPEISTSIQVVAGFPCSDWRATLSSPSQLETGPKALMQRQRFPKWNRPHRNWRRALYYDKRGGLMPQLSRSPPPPQLPPQIDRSFLHFTTRKTSPSHYNHRGFTHLPI